MIKKITISLPEDIHKKCRLIASDSGRTFSGFIKILLNKEIKKERYEK
jgi:hypothetical protein